MSSRGIRPMNQDVVRRWFIPSVIVASLAVAIVPAMGQSVAAASRNLAQDFDYIVLRQNGWRPDALLRTVTVKAADTPLDRVINMIARQAGFDVMFEPRVDADTIRVSIEQADAPAAAVLLAVL